MYCFKSLNICIVLKVELSVKGFFQIVVQFNIDDAVITLNNFLNILGLA